MRWVRPCCQQIELSGFVANELSAFPLPNPEKDIADTELKRRWGMARTEPIESGVEAMPHRIAVTSAISGWARSTSFIDTVRFCIYLGHQRRTLRYGLDLRLNLISPAVIVCQPPWAVKDSQVAIRVAVYPHFDLDVIHAIAVCRDL